MDHRIGVQQLIGRFSKILLIRIFLQIRLICNWTPCRTIQGIIELVISDWPPFFALVRFWNFSRDYSLNCTPLGPSTITNDQH